MEIQNIWTSLNFVVLSPQWNSGTFGLLWESLACLSFTLLGPVWNSRTEFCVAGSFMEFHCGKLGDSVFFDFHALFLGYGIDFVLLKGPYALVLRSVVHRTKVY